MLKEILTKHFKKNLDNLTLKKILPYLREINGYEPTMPQAIDLIVHPHFLIFLLADMSYMKTGNFQVEAS